MTGPPNHHAMIEARRAEATAKRAQVGTALGQMAAEGTPITFAGVARAAQVSTWLVYAPGVREAIEEARDRQPAHKGPAGRPPTSPRHAPACAA